jgi:hypothetical protein
LKVSSVFSSLNGDGLVLGRQVNSQYPETRNVIPLNTDYAEIDQAFTCQHHSDTLSAALETFYWKGTTWTHPKT